MCASHASAQAKLKAVADVRSQYADQARFADHEPAAYFREFVRRIDAALRAEPTVERIGDGQA